MSEIDDYRCVRGRARLTRVAASLSKDKYLAFARTAWSAFIFTVEYSPLAFFFFFIYVELPTSAVFFSYARGLLLDRARNALE